MTKGNPECKALGLSGVLLGHLKVRITKTLESVATVAKLPSKQGSSP